MRCLICQQEIQDTVQFCNQCGCTVTDEKPELEAYSPEGRMQLFASFVRVIREKKRRVERAVEIPLDQLAQVTIVKLAGPTMNLCRLGDVVSPREIGKLMRHSGTLSIGGNDHLTFLAIYDALKKMCPQATFTSCFEKAAPPPTPTKSTVATAPAGTTEARGLNGRIWFDGQMVHLEVKGIRGVKSIPVQNLSAIKYAPATFLRTGSLTLMPSTETVYSEIKHTVIFNQKQQPAFAALKQTIESHMCQPQPLLPAPAPPPAVPAALVADEISKLAALRDQGILTEEEFTVKKRQLLG